MADLIDFSNIGKGIDQQMSQDALAGQRLGYNYATLPGQAQATNAQNAATVSNAGLQINNNARQQQFQMESAALSANPNAQPQDWQALAQKYPEFANQVNQNTNQQQTNWANLRQRMSADAVATVSGMYARLQANDPDGAMQLLEARAVRQENSGDAAGAAQTRSFENLVRQQPDQAKQLASSLLNAASANTAGELYANQAKQAGATVAQNTVPAEIAKANAGASLAGTQAQYAPAQAQATINSTQAGTGLTQAQTGLTNQQITAPPAAIAAAQPEYTSGQTNQQLSDQSGELANAFTQIQNGGTSGVLGATWDQAQRRWTGDTSQLQKLRQEASSLVTQAETASMVNGNYTDAATARAVQNVPAITDSPQAWASYLQARQKFLASKAAWSNARGDWARSNNGSFGPAYRDFTVQLPSGQSAFVKAGDSFTQFSKKAAPSYYTADQGAQSFDPTK